MGEFLLAGSVLGPVLSVMFINDMEENINLLGKFAGDTPLGGVINDEKDMSVLQSHLDHMIIWAHLNNIH